IVETLGVLERSKVAEDLKSLDQPSRAVLRGHGVRFGAYHVYVPALLKPAPRALAAQLWAIKHGGPDLKGLDELQRLAASGRTSFPADKDIQRALYRTIGYRVCAERAVRVDILERLADLIRPALAWRPNSAGVKPPGAFEGVGFTVTQSMTSLTGSSGEDFASILRALGYRMEKRPKPAEPSPAATVSAAEPTPEEAAPSEALGEGAPSEGGTPSTQDGDIVPAEHGAPPEEAASEPPSAEVVETGADQSAREPGANQGAREPVREPPTGAADSAQEAFAHPAVGESASDAAAESQAEAAPAPEAADSVPEHAAADEGPGSDGTSEAVATPPEPELVEVWRPGGRSEDRRGGRRPAHRQHRDRVQPTADAAVAAEGRTAAADGERERPHHRRHRRGPPGEFRREGGERREGREHGAPRSEGGSARRGSERPAAGGDRQATRSPENRESESVGGQEHRQRQEERRGREHRDARRNQEHRRYDAKDRRDAGPRREREKQPDPNSPFAKLAALKAQLEANAKEPH
ncbi:MAG: helicase, partial [Xanthobacteraceae bacterium]|nr:helicase [Xanthobacteraceae bacterium]